MSKLGLRHRLFYLCQKLDMNGHNTPKGYTFVSFGVRTMKIKQTKV